MKPEEESKSPDPVLDEFERLRKLVEALAGADKETSMRMLHWAADKFVGCTLCHKTKLSR